MTGNGWLPTDPIRLVSANIDNYLMAGFVRKTVIQFSAIYFLEVLIVLKNSVSGRSVKISAPMTSFILSEMRAHMKLTIYRQRALHSLTQENCIALPENMY